MRSLSGQTLEVLFMDLHTNDYDLISRSLKDVVVEPFRSQLIPGFEDIKKAALENGALGTGISGSGPSVFSLCKSEPLLKMLKKPLEKPIKIKIYRLKFMFQK